MKALLKKINNSYLLELESYNPKTIEIDGKRIKDFKNGWLKNKPSSLKLVEERSRVINYGSLTPDEYQTQLDKLIQDKDEDGYPIFTDIDKEYVYKKFLQDHPASYEKYEDIQDLEITEYDITGNTDNPFIVPYRFVGKEVTKDDAVLYQYVAQPYKLAQTIASELGLEEVEDKSIWGGQDNTKGMKWSCPSHSRDVLNYTKVNGNYADYKGMKFYSISSGTYEECLKRYNEHYSSIKSMFSKEIKKLKAEGLKYDKSKVIKELESIKNLIKRIDSKARSEIQPYLVSNRIQKFIDEL